MTPPKTPILVTMIYAVAIMLGVFCAVGWIFNFSVIQSEQDAQVRVMAIAGGGATTALIAILIMGLLGIAQAVNYLAQTAHYTQLSHDLLERMQPRRAESSSVKYPLP